MLGVPLIIDPPCGDFPESVALLRTLLSQLWEAADADDLLTDEARHQLQARIEEVQRYVDAVKARGMW